MEVVQDEGGDPVRGEQGESPLVLAGIFVLALALRGLHQAAMWASPFSPSVYLPIDARLQHIWAIDWLNGSWPPLAAFERPPLFTFFLGSIYAGAGPGSFPVLIIQALFGAGSCLLVYGISRELSDDRRVARSAALVCAVCGPLIYFDGQLLSASLDVFLGLLLLRVLFLAGRGTSPLLWPAAGLLAGLSALNRGAVLLFVPFVLVWIVRFAQPSTARASAGRRAAGLLGAAGFAAGVGLIVLPVSWHNARYDSPGEDTSVAAGVRRLASGGFVPIASNTGLNFYLGNHRSLREINRVEHPDHMAVYDRIRLEAVEDGIASYSAANRSLVAKTVANAARWPGDWLALMGLKLAELVNGTEIPRNTSIYADRGHSPVLRALLWRVGLAFPSGLLIPLGLVGIALARHEWRRHFLVLSALGVQALFVSAFFVTSRYRLPMLPLLAPYAAIAGITLFDAWRAGSRARAERLTGALAVVLALCNLPFVAVSGEHHWMEHNNLAAALIEHERRDEAEIQLRRAVELNPSSSVAATGLCDLLLDSGRPRDALPFCRAAVAAGPGSAAAHYNLGAALEANGRSHEAIQHYRQAAHLAPQAGEPRSALRRLETAR